MCLWVRVYVSFALYQFQEKVSQHACNGVLCCVTRPSSVVFVRAVPLWL